MPYSIVSASTRSKLEFELVFFFGLVFRGLDGVTTTFIVACVSGAALGDEPFVCFSILGNVLICSSITNSVVCLVIMFELAPWARNTCSSLRASFSFSRVNISCCLRTFSRNFSNCEFSLLQFNSIN